MGFIVEEDDKDKKTLAGSTVNSNKRGRTKDSMTKERRGSKGDLETLNRD